MLGAVPTIVTDISSYAGMVSAVLVAFAALNKTPMGRYIRRAFHAVFIGPIEHVVDSRMTTVEEKLHSLDTKVSDIVRHVNNSDTPLHVRVERIEKLMVGHTRNDPKD